LRNSPSKLTGKIFRKTGKKFAGSGSRQQDSKRPFLVRLFGPAAAGAPQARLAAQVFGLIKLFADDTNPGATSSIMPRIVATNELTPAT
jgi:hypothetical protein